MSSNQSKRKIVIEEGVRGEEISIYLTNYDFPTIKVSYLYKKLSIYKDVLKIYFHESMLDNFDVLNWCNLLYYKLTLDKPKRKSEVFQIITQIFSSNQIRNLEVTQLDELPYYQVTIARKGYMKYSKLIQQQFFVKPLLKKYNIGDV
ncbi:MAG: hypothetical protein EOM19_07040 [Candidatus Moranbacteria bacterium]|nr:hypothetical protein [Candidatus Moranbacteria bacterium]